MMRDADLTQHLKDRQAQTLLELKEVSDEIKELCEKRNKLINKGHVLGCSLADMGRATHVSRQAIWNQIKRKPLDDDI